MYIRFQALFGIFLFFFGAVSDTVKPKMYIASRKAGGGALVGGRGNKGEGTSGAYRVVDKRLKKDKRGKKNAERRARRPKRRH